MKAAGIRFPNSFSYDGSSFPKYHAQKTTQTDPWPPKEPRPPVIYRSDKVKSAAFTPTREEVIANTTGLSYANRMGMKGRRTRSRSPPTPQPLKAAAATEFTTPTGSRRKRSSSVGSPLLTSTQEGNTSRNLFPKSAEKAVEKAAQVVEKESEKTEEAKKNDAEARRRQMYNEILEEEATAKAEHEQNKKDKIYHFCPKLNFDYHNSSEYWEHRRKFEDEEGIPYDSTASSLHVTDTSCNSTCECARSKTQEVSFPRSSSGTSKFNSSRTPQSTFLHCSTSDTSASFVTVASGSLASTGDESGRRTEAAAEPTESGSMRGTDFVKETKESCIPSTQTEPADATVSSAQQTNSAAMKDTEGESCILPTQTEPADAAVSSAQQTDSESMKDTEGESCIPPTQTGATDFVKETEEESATSSAVNSSVQSTERSEEPMDSGASEFPPSTAFQPQHYTQIRPEGTRISPQLRGQRHIIAVNTANVPLDVSQLPENISLLGYSPHKGVFYRTHDDDDVLPPPSPEEPASSSPTRGPSGSPKRPPSSPSSSRPKRVASDPDSGSDDFQFTQVEAMPDRKSQ